MRASPVFQISIRRYGWWRAAVPLVAGYGAATIAAWLATRETAPSGGMLLATASAGALMLWLVISLCRWPDVNLRWDGRVWHLGAVSPARDDSAIGDLRVVIDLGPWMLLRFTPAARGLPSRPVWLPVQRRGAEAQWHALRCAVYSPRPVPGADAAPEL